DGSGRNPPFVRLHGASSCAPHRCRRSGGMGLVLNHLFAAIVTCAHASSAVPAVPHHQVSCAALPMQAGQLDVRLPSSDETSPSSDDDKIESAPAKKIKSGKKRTKDQRRSAEEDGWGAGWKQ